MLSSHELNIQLTGWLPVEGDVEIKWDLESTPLEFRTNNALGSDGMVGVYFYSAEGENVGGLQIDLHSPLQYHLDWCSETMTNLPVNPPSPSDQVWRITLTRTAGIRVVIHCNDVEVINILMSDSTCHKYSKWSRHWNRNVTKIRFRSTETPADYYRPQPGD